MKIFMLSIVFILVLSINAMAFTLVKERVVVHEKPTVKVEWNYKIEYPLPQQPIFYPYWAPYPYLSTCCPWSSWYLWDRGCG